MVHAAMEQAMLHWCTDSGRTGCSFPWCLWRAALPIASQTRLPLVVPPSFPLSLKSCSSKRWICSWKDCAISIVKDGDTGRGAASGSGKYKRSLIMPLETSTVGTRKRKGQ